MYGGGYGGGYGGYGGMIGPNGDPNMRGGFENSTAATFQLIESIVGAFGGFAQMLESTYMATHSSFFAMISVAEQFGNLRNSLGSMLGIFAILRWFRKIVARMQGNPLPDEPKSETSKSITPESFADFQASSNARPPLGARPSFKPLLFFLAAVFGLPYLLRKLIQSIASQQQHAQLYDEHGNPQQQMLLSNSFSDTPIDPSQLEFCRALYAFVPENPQIELELHKGDLLAIIAKEDPSGQPSEWWRVRTREGRSGYVPSTYVEILPRTLEEPPKITPLAGESSPSSFSVEEFQRAALQS